MTKRAKFKEPPVPSKRPKINVDPTGYLDLHPSWRVSIIQTVDPFGWHVATLDELRTIQQRLANLETMSWSEILIRGKHWNHNVELAQICPEARANLAEIGQDDVDAVLSLRLTNVGRVWGLFQAGVVRVLWWDPQHSICPGLPR